MRSVLRQSNDLRRERLRGMDVNVASSSGTRRWTQENSETAVCLKPRGWLARDFLHSVPASQQLRQLVALFRRGAAAVGPAHRRRHPVMAVNPLGSRDSDVCGAAALDGVESAECAGLVGDAHKPERRAAAARVHNLDDGQLDALKGGRRPGSSDAGGLVSWRGG